MKKNVFISYSQKDKEKVSLFASLLANNNYDVWMDVKSISLGESIISAVAKGLDNADIYMLFISSHSNNSPWVSEELNIALTKSVEKQKPKIIPILLDDCIIPLTLTGRLYLDARNSIQAALQQLNKEFSIVSNCDEIITLPNKPVLSGVVFGLSKTTNICIGGGEHYYDNEFGHTDLINERESIQRELRKKANGVLMNFVPLSDFDLQSPIPKFKNGSYDETIERVAGKFDASVSENVSVQATIFNPEYAKIYDLVKNKLDKLRANTLTYIFTIPFQSEGFDKKCMQKIQDNYSIISYDYDEGATIEYNSNFFISIKCTLEQVFMKLHTEYGFSFSKKAASFIPDDFIKWITN